MADTTRWQYLYDLVPGTDLVTIADIGANPINPAPYQALLDSGLCTVIGFEPNKEAFDALVKNASAHEKYFNVAVGPAGKRSLNLYPASGLSSLYPLDPEALGHLSKFQGQIGRETAVDIDLMPMDSIEELPAIDLLKIDVQGAELEIIKSGRKKLRGACAMIIETRIYPIYEGEPSWRALDIQLRRMGFGIHKFLSQAHFAFGNDMDLPVRMPMMRSQLLDADAVYIPTAKRFGGMTDAQLIKEAVLADSVYGSFDVVLKCLEALHQRGTVNRDQVVAYCRLLPPELQKREA